MRLICASGRTVAPGLPLRAAHGWNPASHTGTYRAGASSGDFFSADEREIAELFTSSSGARKASRFRIAPFIFTCCRSATFYNDETMVELRTIPLFHANGWGRPQCATFHGLKQVMVRRFDPACVLRLIQEERATSMSLVPTMANALLN
jgi:fatty-acyl-CoA synthase